MTAQQETTTTPEPEPELTPDQQLAKAVRDARLGLPILYAAFLIAERTRGTEAAKHVLTREAVGDTEWTTAELMVIVGDLLAIRTGLEREIREQRMVIEALRAAMNERLS